MQSVELKLIHAYEIDRATSKAINGLLQSSFSDAEYQGRDYFKQLPHHRILAFNGEGLIGHLGIDFRVMSLNGEGIHVFGVVDLCVDAKHQGKGIGRSLLEKFEAIARSNPKIDFLFLVAQDSAYYETLGYQVANIETTWFKIDQHKSYGLGQEKITDASFLYKQISNKVWVDGGLDLLGHMY